MKGSSLFIAHDYRELYDSSCNTLKHSIINALGEIFLLTGLETFSLSKGSAVKVGDNEFVGICVKDNCLHFVVNNKEKVRKARSLKNLILIYKTGFHLSKKCNMKLIMR